MAQKLGSFKTRSLADQEAAVLAHFLKGICLAVSVQRPHDQHAASLGWAMGSRLFPRFRLRAAVFVNLVAMRECMTKRVNEQRALLDPGNLDILRRACFLFHAAHNSYSIDLET